MAEAPRSPEVKVEAPQKGAEAADGAPLSVEAQRQLDTSATAERGRLDLAGGIDAREAGPADTDAAEADPDASTPLEADDQPGDGDDAPPDGDGTTDDKPEKKGWLAGIKDTVSSWLGDGIRDLIDLFENVLKWTGVAAFLRWITNTPKEETETAEDLSTEIATAIGTVKDSKIKDALAKRLKAITDDTARTADVKKPDLEKLQKDTECYTRAEALEAKIAADPKLKTEFEPKMKAIKDADLNVTDGNVADPTATLGKIDALEQEFDAKANPSAEQQETPEIIEKKAKIFADHVVTQIFEISYPNVGQQNIDDLKTTYSVIDFIEAGNLANNVGSSDDNYFERLQFVLQKYIARNKEPSADGKTVYAFLEEIGKSGFQAQKEGQASHDSIEKFKAILANEQYRAEFKRDSDDGSDLPQWSEPDYSSLTATQTPAAEPQQPATPIPDEPAPSPGRHA